jgi:type II secretion system protein G
VEKRNKNKKRGGFTLIELLVVITIIGILTMVTVNSFVVAQKRSRDAARKAGLKSLADALNMYYADYGEFPGEAYINGLVDDQGEFSVEVGNNEVIYMKKVPKGDGNGVDKMKYDVADDDLKSFKLFANLENENDGDCEETCSEYSNGCCYVITSSNIGVEDDLD